MSSILLPRRFYSQPQGAVQIDYSGLGRGIVFAATPFFNTANLVRSGTTVGYVPSKHGVGVDVAAGVNYFSYPDAGKIAPPLTILSFYTVLTVPAAASRVAGNFYAGSNGYVLAPNATNFRAILARAGVNTVLVGSTVAAKDKRDVLVVDSTHGRYYENGALTAGPTAHGGVASATGDFRIGYTDDGGFSVHQRNFLTCIWSRALSEKEVNSVSANPWQIFKASE